MSAGAPIVVLTPVRNEAAILERFLSVTSAFADLIVVADQHSSDGTPDIVRKYSSAVLVSNPSTAYDEGSRQTLLIEEARRRVAGRKILLALDADEIVAADALEAPGWQAMRSAPAGSVLCFEKPDLYASTRECLRYDRPWPLGYVDDGAPHAGGPVHSLRIPTPQAAPRLELVDVKVLHYALTRLDYQRSKVRYYSALENVLGTQPVWARRLLYSSRRDWARLGRLAPSDPAWFLGWERLGIDMHTIPQERFHWQDFEVLRLFRARGEARFWLDDLWAFDWEACRAHALALGVAGLPERPVRRPPAVTRPAGALLDAAYAAWLAAKRLSPAPEARALP